ncbi:hypothetical protein K3495_g5865 [Podosphaera aphanis]|nr:hypothetical protein K3495_g5865 [Podosphaera aphanis]
MIPENNDQSFERTEYLVSRINLSPTCYVLPSNASDESIKDVLFACAVACTSDNGTLSQYKNLITTYTNCIFNGILRKVPKHHVVQKKITENDLKELATLRKEIDVLSRDPERPVPDGIFARFKCSWDLPQPSDKTVSDGGIYCRTPKTLYAHYSLVAFLAGILITDSNRKAITQARPKALIEKFKIECTSLLNDWVGWLPSAEFNANNTESVTTKVTSFFANTAQHPRSAISPPRKLGVSGASDNIRIQQNLANSFVDQMNDLNDFLRENMKTSQAYYETYANKHRAIPPSYQVGDKVFVNAKNIKTRRPCKKLDWKNLGPFRIAELVSTHSYRLLRPDPGNPLPGQSNDPNPPIEVDEFGEDLYEVDAVIGSRRHKSRGFEYRVKYTGDMKTSWQPLSDIVSDNLSESLSSYHHKHPRRPKPSSKEIPEARAAAKVSTQLADQRDST